jgi:SlyX protein
VSGRPPGAGPGPRAAESAAAPEPPAAALAPAALEDRLVELELKAVWAEDLLEQLDEVVARQQAQIEGLARELGRLRERLAAAEAAAAAGGTAPSLRDELPPHY